jgi:hypothetical protein
MQRTTLAAVLAFSAMLPLTGCGGYGEVSPQAYAHAQSLYTVCNQKNSELLERVARNIATAQQAGELKGEEVDWLGAIVEDARAGEWQAACKSCRSLLSDQVKY